MRGWMAAAGIKQRAYDGRGCHSMRHTKASEVMDAIGDIRAVQQLLGHAHISSSQIYVRPIPMDKLREAMEAPPAA